MDPSKEKNCGILVRYAALLSWHAAYGSLNQRQLKASGVKSYITNRHGTQANRIAPGVTPQNAASHLRLFCLLTSMNFIENEKSFMVPLNFFFFDCGLTSR